MYGAVPRTVSWLSLEEAWSFDGADGKSPEVLLNQSQTFTMPSLRSMISRFDVTMDNSDGVSSHKVHWRLVIPISIASPTQAGQSYSLAQSLPIDEFGRNEML